MLPVQSLHKKTKSPNIDHVVNSKTSITCTNVPEGLFESNAAKKHFNKFGRVHKIRLFPKRQMCIVEYDQPVSVGKAVLNAGAFDGFMFDVTRSKPRIRKKSKREEDPDWLPDSDVEEELSAMAGTPTYRILRPTAMNVTPEVGPSKPKSITRVVKQSPIRTKFVSAKTQPITSSTMSGIESPIIMTVSQTSMSTAEAAAELNQLRSKVPQTPDEQWRLLDARDKILRAWGGAGSRVKVGGATIGLCPDMCPEKERLHRQAEHQVMTLEARADSELDPRRALKQYSRSSADQEMPMGYELRPPAVLARTCAYLLHEIADTSRQVTRADWFHFMWDRLRSIRKDITQQALCCAESIRLVEMCARFHAHCAARLADLEHTQFDQRLNTDNLTKCLQTLKHMYMDVKPEQKPNEPEFRSYIALLNLGDANFWWEIKQLPEEIQKSSAIVFSVQIFNALDNNNYIRFFRLVKENATYLQSCILLRYFNDVRARALARIVKAYAPRGGSRYPAQDLFNALAFESIEHMKSFINHYGLRFAKTDESDLTIILDRNQFIEDSDPYPIARAVQLIESKRNTTVGRVIAGGELPIADYNNHVLYSSFNADGKLKESALIAEDYGYNTINDSNKDIKMLKAEIQRLVYGKSMLPDKQESQKNVFAKAILPTLSIVSDEQIVFSFNPATPIEPTEDIQNFYEKKLDNVTFSFSKPEVPKLYLNPGIACNKFVLQTIPASNLFATKSDLESNKVLGIKEDIKHFVNSNSIFSSLNTKINDFNKQESSNSLFEASKVEHKQTGQGNNLFGNVQNKNLFVKKDEVNTSQNVFGKNLFLGGKDGSFFSKMDNTGKFEKGGSIFGKTTLTQENLATETSKNIFGSFSQLQHRDANNAGTSTQNQERPIFAINGGDTKLSPSSLFKSACNQPEGANTTSYTIFQGKNNKAQTVADNILKSVNTAHTSVYDFRENEDVMNQHEQLQQLREERRILEENKLREKLMREEMQKQEELRLFEEQKRREEELRRQEEIKRQEEMRIAEEKRKQEELKMRLEEERLAEIKRKEEEERQFRAAVDKESCDLLEKLIDEIKVETVVDLLKEEVGKLKKLMKFAGHLTEHIMNNICVEMCRAELKAEKFRIDKLRRKWFNVWKEQCLRNFKRRNCLQDTPVWLPNKTPIEEAKSLRRKVENVALSKMNAFHRGYIFKGELIQIPSPERYNIVEIIRSPLLKRLKEMNYPYDQCVFWKVTLVSPGETKWLLKKINIHKWLVDVFSDKKSHEVSPSLIQLTKESWNTLMDFAISVSLINRDKIGRCGEAVEGMNGLMFYFTEKDNMLLELINEILKHKYKYQVIPLAIITPQLDDSICNSIQTFLNNSVKRNYIKAYRIFIVDNKNVPESLNLCTKSAMKWIAKNCPQTPPLEIDNLKSMCQRYLGNEIWCNFKSERDPRMKVVIRDLNKLVSCYNIAVEKLKEILTNSDLFNYASFPLEFKQFLDNVSPYPKPYEFIPSAARTSENISAIEYALNSLKLPTPMFPFAPFDVYNMQKQIRTYSYQIGWFENPEKVVCKVIAKLPDEFTDLNTSQEDFSRIFQSYDLIDFLNVLVYEKINSLQYFRKIYVVYEKSSLDQYRTADWLFNTNLLCNIKHKPLDYGDDDVDYYIASKRRKIERDSMEILMLEDKDVTLVEKNIKITDASLAKYSGCTEAIKELEMKLEEGTKKSIEFENFLKLALQSADFKKFL